MKPKETVSIPLTTTGGYQELLAPNDLSQSLSTNPPNKRSSTGDPWRTLVWQAHCYYILFLRRCRSLGNCPHSVYKLIMAKCRCSRACSTPSRVVWNLVCLRYHNYLASYCSFYRPWCSKAVGEKQVGQDTCKESRGLVGHCCTLFGPTLRVILSGFMSLLHVLHTLPMVNSWTAWW